MYRKLGKMLMILSMLAVLAGCSGGSRVITVGDIEITMNEMRGKYHHFSGNYFKKVKIREGERLVITYSVHTEKGDLTAKVIDADEHVLALLEHGKTVVVDEPGKYTLLVTGDNHRGKFTVSWVVESA